MTKDRIELGIPTEAGFVGVKIPSQVAILGMKIGTGYVIGFFVLIIVAIAGLWWYFSSEKGYATSDTPPAKSEIEKKTRWV